MTPQRRGTALTVDNGWARWPGWPVQSSKLGVVSAPTQCCRDAPGRDAAAW